MRPTGTVIREARLFASLHGGHRDMRASGEFGEGSTARWVQVVDVIGGAARQLFPPDPARLVWQARRWSQGALRACPRSALS